MVTQAGPHDLEGIVRMHCHGPEDFPFLSFYLELFRAQHF